MENFLWFYVFDLIKQAKLLPGLVSLSGSSNQPSKTKPILVLLKPILVLLWIYSENQSSRIQSETKGYVSGPELDQSLASPRVRGPTARARRARLRQVSPRALSILLNMIVYPPPSFASLSPSVRCFADRAAGLSSLPLWLPAPPPSPVALGSCVEV